MRILIEKESLTSIAILVVLLMCMFTASPRNISTHYFTVEPGDSSTRIAQRLSDEGLIQYDLVYKIIVKLLLLDNDAKSGTYAVEKGENLISWIQRIHTGDFRIEPIKVRLVEGLNVYEIADVLEETLLDFDSVDFAVKAAPYEGFLFPDTYLVLPDATPDAILTLLRETFVEKTEDLFFQYDVAKEEIADIVNLASIVEEETFNNEDRRIVAGVLQNRLKINMPLQVDVTFKYINGKNSYTLTLDDLREDSPYNTYTNTGLPPTPISNPSLESIEAVLNPIENDYLYFLSSRSGKMYYAKTFEGHKRNRNLYL